MPIAIGSKVRLAQEDQAIANLEPNNIRPQPPRFGTVTGGADPWDVLFENGRFVGTIPEDLLWEVLAPTQDDIDNLLNRIVRLASDITPEKTARIVDVMQIEKSSGAGARRRALAQTLRNGLILEVDLTSTPNAFVVLEDR